MNRLLLHVFLLMGFISSAYATQNLDTPTAPLVYASENNSTAITGAALNVTAVLNPNSMREDTDMRVQLDLSNGAVFTSAPTMNDITNQNSDAQPFSILTGGAGASMATFNGNTGSGGFAGAETFSINITGVTVVNQDAVDITVTVKIADNFGVTTVKNVRVPYLAFDDAIAVSFSPDASVDKIDSGQDSLFFDGSAGDRTTKLGTIAVSFTPRLNANGSALLSINDILANVDFGLSAANNLGAFNQGGGSVTFATIAGVITGSNAVLMDVVPSAAATAVRDVVVTVPTANTIPIAETTMMGSTTGDAQPGFINTTITKTGSLASLTAGDQDGDGVGDSQDNCPTTSNADQLNTDGDGEGNVCDSDDDNDSVLDSNDAFPLDVSETVDTDGDSIGNNADTDDDGDGVSDSNDAFPLDASETLDTDGDSIGNNADTDDDGDGVSDSNDAFPLDPTKSLGAESSATQYLQTTSTSANITRLHIINSSDSAQLFTATLFNQDGNRLGAADQPLSGAPVAAKGRLVLSSSDLETIFGVPAWSGPAMLEVIGEGKFDLMSKLVSPSGLVSNTNCTRQDRVLNIEGFDSQNMTFVRFINTSNNALSAITGTLYDGTGNVIGSANATLVDSLAPKEQVWVNRDNFAVKVGAQWNGEAMLEVNSFAGLKLLNLNFVNNETFFNFSCFESSTSGRIYLQTTSNSDNVSFSHIVNTSTVAQQFSGTLYNKDGVQLGASNQPLHSGLVPAKGRVILSSAELEAAFATDAWSGPAMVEVSGSNSFELMTKLTSPSGLISNTNCVRTDQVHNIGGFDSPHMTYVRFINTGSTTISNLKGSLYDSSGILIGSANRTLLSTLAPKSAAWLNRDNLSNIFQATWNGEALLTVDAEVDLRLLNLNFVNGETFFNFSCYESGDNAGESSNQRPVASPISISADSSLPFIEQNLIASDPDGDTIFFDLVSDTDGVGYTQAYVNPEEGVLYLTPTSGYFGTIKIDYRVSDGQLFSQTAQVTIDVLDTSSDENTLGAEDIDPRVYAGFEIITYNSELLGVAGEDAVQPQSVDLSSNFPIPGDQGSQGSCVGWATAYALKSYQEVAEIGWSPNSADHVFSPSYIYNQINLGSCDNGSYIHEALQLIVDQGVATLSSMPYSQNSCSAQPSAFAIQEAANFKALRKARVNDTADVKAALANRLPVVIGFKIYSQFYNLFGPDSVYNTVSGSSDGGHAVTIVGYDDRRYGGAFRLINSWGRGWGDGGYFWLPYNMFQEVVYEAWVLEDQDNAALQPPVDRTIPESTEDLPNLQVQSWKASYDPVPSGEGTLEYTVINTGPGVASSGADINLMLSKNQTISSNDIYVVYEEILFDLDTGSTVFRDSANALRFSFPPRLQEGIYYMGMWVDDLLEVEETNENDNVNLDPIPKTISNTKPDLAVWTWYASWDSSGDGTLTYEVRNIGGGTASNADWDINLVLSPDEFIGNGNEIFLFYEDAGFSLAPNGGSVYRDQSNPASFSVLRDQLGVNVPTGTYYIALWVDDLQQVDESNELNNYSLGGSTVVITSSTSSTSSTSAGLKNPRRNANSAYNGKILSDPNLVKVRVSTLPSGKRHLEILDRNLSQSSEENRVYLKRAASKNAVIFPTAEQYRMR